jgi:diguanylate cyclase (GGDEF)-like protein
MKRRIDSMVCAKWFAAAGAVAVFALAVSVGEGFLQAQQREADDQRRIEMTSYAATLRARVERELNSLLYLSSGLGSYLVVRNDSIPAKEITEILAVLHKDSRHVRNFGIAVGYRLTYVYPLAGNEKAVGLDYRDLPHQWPAIQRIVASGKPALAGPIDLVQGGSGLVYRAPLFLNGRFWGLLSTVIDTDSLLASVFEESMDNRFAYALRGKDGLGVKGDRIVGDIGLFVRPDAVVEEIDIPGGRWAIAVTPRAGSVDGNLVRAARVVVALGGGLVAWMFYALMRSRSELARMVMFDGLTGLPNRRQLTDRARIAFARQRRHPDQACALLFLDMDGFKEINDLYGHQAGDAVLQETADRCRALVRGEDTVARWGGDEFVVLLQDVAEDAVRALVARLREALEAPVAFDGQQIKTGVSVGIVIHHEGDASLDEILEVADERMYIDKSQRKAIG